MNEKEFRKLVRTEVKAILQETDNFRTKKSKSAGTLSDVLVKFYLYLIRNDLHSAEQYLKNNPELLKMAKNIKQQNSKLASELFKDKDFIKFLLGDKE